MTRSAFIVGVVVVMTALPLPAEEKKTEGKEVKPLLVMHGRKSKIDEASCLRITTADVWQKLWAKHRTGSPQLRGLPNDFEEADFDFAQIQVIGVFDGISEGRGGIYLHQVLLQADQLVVRIKAFGNQTVFDGINRIPDSLSEKLAKQNTDWIIVVIPKSNVKVVVQKDVSNNRDVSKWQDLKSFPSLEK